MTAPGFVRTACLECGATYERPEGVLVQCPGCGQLDWIEPPTSTDHITTAPAQREIHSSAPSVPTMREGRLIQRPGFRPGSRDQARRRNSAAGDAR